MLHASRVGGSPSNLTRRLVCKCHAPRGGGCPLRGGADARGLPEDRLLVEFLPIAVDESSNGGSRRRVFGMYEEQHLRSLVIHDAVGTPPLALGFPHGQPFRKPCGDLVAKKELPFELAHRSPLQSRETEVKSRPELRRRHRTTLCHRRRLRPATHRPRCPDSKADPAYKTECTGHREAHACISCFLLAITCTRCQAVRQRDGSQFITARCLHARHKA